MTVDIAARFLTLRVTPAEYASLKEAADKAGLYLSEYVRRLIFARAGLPRSDAHKPRGKYPRKPRSASSPPSDPSADV